MSDPPSLAERAHTALGEAFGAAIGKILDRAAADLATPDKDMQGLGVTATRLQMIRNMLGNLKSAYAEVAEAIDEVFGASQ
jgi:hypothetical protein